jgi:UDP-N-acetylmuramoyl-tripeptide--D-alanyl-D-alanine ligase
MAAKTDATVLRYSVRHDGPASPTADVVADSVVLDSELRPRFVVRSPWGAATVRLEARGAHQVGNALAALTVALCSGVTLERAVPALEAAGMSPWRMELRYSPAGAAILNDAYNANPASMRAGLEALAALPAHRRTAVLGEMAELGQRSQSEHAAIATLADQLGVELLAVATDAYGVRPVRNIDEAMAVLATIGPGDAVLVKASRVAGLERLAARLYGGRPPGQAGC